MKEIETKALRLIENMRMMGCSYSYILEVLDPKFHYLLKNSPQQTFQKVEDK